MSDLNTTTTLDDNPITSVNSPTVNSRKGGEDGPNLAKILFGLASGIIVLGAAWYGVKYFTADDAAKKKNDVVEPPSKATAAVTTRRNDLGAPTETMPSASAAQGSVLPALAPASASGPCLVKPLTGPTGTPIIGPDGRPMQIDCKGQVVKIGPLPDIAPQGGNTSGAAGAGSNKSTSKPVPPPDRFAGDIFANATGARTAANQTSQRDNPALAALANLAKQSTGTPGAAQPGATGGQQSEAQSAFAGGGNSSGLGAGQTGSVGSMLNSTNVARAYASKLGNASLMLPQGTSIPCSLTTKVVSEVSGFATCTLTSNVYSADGSTVLFDRGSQALGEYVAGVAQGTRRLHILWSRIRTPHNVVVSIGSPAASTLGTMGVDGYVDNRWFDRLGAALLLSLVQDGITFGLTKLNRQEIPTAAAGSYIEGKPVTSSQKRETTTVVNEDGSTTVTELNSSTGYQAGVVIPPQNQNITFGQSSQQTQQTVNQMAEKVLAGSIGMKPVIYKNQGDRISIFVARDVFFDGVYGLQKK